MFNKTTKRKANRKNFSSSMGSKSTLVHSSSMAKLKTHTKKSKPKTTNSKGKA